MKAKDELKIGKWKQSEIVMAGIAIISLLWIIFKKKVPTAYACPICGATFSTQEELNAHMAAVHPGKLPVPTPPPSKIPDPPALQANTQYYTVIKGEYLEKIAEKFSTTIANLLILNPQIVNPDMIWEGQIILVPTPTSTPPVVTPTPAPIDTLVRKAQCAADILIEIGNACKGVYGTSGVRELIYKKLVAKYPEFATLIGDTIYKQLPDGWEEICGLIKPTTPTSTPTPPPTPPPAPVSTYPLVVTVNVSALYVRSAPNTSAPLAGSQILYYGDTFIAVGYVTGENISGESRWYQSSLGHFCWVGGVIPKP